jgi:arginine decarboxylase
MTELGYKGEYRGVFPIKVNQQQQVIEEVVTHGAAWHHGLEAGSKPELIIALTYLKDSDSLIICNGYKDQEFIDLALMGVKAGMKVFLVVERPGEISTIIRRARELGVKPRIGIRAKLSSTVGGKWASSAGDHSVFGLNPSQIIAAVDNLAEEGMLDCLELLHYHLGSQIPDIRSIRTAAGEAARGLCQSGERGSRDGLS